MGVSDQHTGVQYFAQGTNPKPFLVRYGISPLDPSKSLGFAYDVENNAWVTLPALQLPAHNSKSLAGVSGVVSAVTGLSEDSLLYKLTSSASSAESFGETWYETPVMTFPRWLPVVSVALGIGMGHKVVVAGGELVLRDGHRAVEVFDSQFGTWESRGPLLEQFSRYDSRGWISAIVCDNKFYVSLLHAFGMDKGQIHSLDFYTKQWASIQLESPKDLLFSCIVTIGTTLVVAGLCADSTVENFAVKLWKVDLETLTLIQIGLMPSQLLDLRQGRLSMPFLKLHMNENLLKGRPSSMPFLPFLVDKNLVYVTLGDGELAVAEVSLEECKTDWRRLPDLSGLGFDWFITFCASITSA